MIRSAPASVPASPAPVSPGFATRSRTVTIVTRVALFAALALVLGACAALPRSLGEGDTAAAEPAPAGDTVVQNPWLTPAPAEPSPPATTPVPTTPVPTTPVPTTRVPTTPPATVPPVTAPPETAPPVTASPTTPPTTPPTTAPSVEPRIVQPAVPVPSHVTVDEAVELMQGALLESHEELTAEQAECMASDWFDAVAHEFPELNALEMTELILGCDAPLSAFLN